MPYDVVLDVNGNLFKVQVKTTIKEIQKPQAKSVNPVYRFCIGRNGRRNSRSEYPEKDVDLFALVVLETLEIAYIPNKDIKGTMNFRIPRLKEEYLSPGGVYFNEFPLSKALEGLL